MSIVYANPSFGVLVLITRGDIYNKLDIERPILVSVVGAKDAVTITSLRGRMAWTGKIQTLTTLFMVTKTNPGRNWGAGLGDANSLLHFLPTANI